MGQKLHAEPRCLSRERAVDFLRGKSGIFLQKAPDHVVVFFAEHRTRGIVQRAALFHVARTGGKYGELRFGKIGKALFRAEQFDIGIIADDAETRADDQYIQYAH